MRAQGHPHRIQSFQLQVHHYRKRGSGLIWIVFVLFSLGAFSLVSHNFVAEGTTFYNDPLTQVRFLKLRLLSNCPESLKGHGACPSSDKGQYPIWHVCRGVQFAPWILGRFGFEFLCLIGGSALYMRRGNMRLINRLGLAIFGLGWLLLLGPVPWDLGPCPADASQEQTGYRQTFQHNTQIVPHKHLDTGFAAPCLPRLEIKTVDFKLGHYRKRLLIVFRLLPSYS